MTPQEKDLIQSVFDRLARSGVGQKDAEAEALIRENMQRLPDAAYGLVQAVIMQEMGLNQATTRINELQRQLDEARSHGSATGGSFLGGASPWGGGSVPRSGPAPAASQQPAYAPGPAAYAQPQPAYAPPPQQAAGPWSQQPSAAGGFLRNAATMAAGVAGGTLIAEGLSSLFGGHHFGGGGFGGLAGGSPWGGNGGVVENVTVNNFYGDQAGADSYDDRGAQDTSYDDQGVQDTSYDDQGFDNGSDGGYDGSTDV
jgi:hypothetical protein